jgi:hypothetical protein
MAPFSWGGGGLIFNRAPALLRRALCLFRGGGLLHQAGDCGPYGARAGGAHRSSFKKRGR